MLFIASVLLAMPYFAHAQYSPRSLNISGQLFQPTTGLPVTNTSVNFRLEIWDKNLTCKLFEETHNAQNLAATKGGFSLQLGEGNVSNNYVSGGADLTWQVFANPGAPATTVTGCVGGVVLTPGDNRMIRVYYDLGSGMTAMTPEVPIESSAYAMVADTIQGRSLADLIVVRDDVGTDLTQSNVENIFSASNYAKLVQLLTNTLSASYSFNNQTITNVGTPSAGGDAVNKTYADTRLAGSNVNTAGVASGNTLIWNGSAWMVGTPSATDNTKLPLAGGIMSGPLTLQHAMLGKFNNAQEGALGLAAGDAGRIFYNTDTNQLRLWNGTTYFPFGSGAPTGVAGGDLTGTYPNPTINVSTITTAKIATDAITAGKIDNAGIGINRLLISDGTDPNLIRFKTCALNQILQWQGTGWVCTDVNAALPTTGIAAGVYGSATTVSRIGLNAQGVATLAQNVAIAFPVTSVAGKTGAVTLNPLDVGVTGTAALYNVGDLSGELPMVQGNGKLSPSVIPTMSIGDISGAITQIVASSPIIGGGTSGVITIGIDPNLTSAAMLRGNAVLAGVPADNQVLTWNATGARWEARAPGAGADNLGSHVAAQNIQLNGFWLTNDGVGNDGIRIDNSGNVGVGTTGNTTAVLDVWGAAANSAMIVPRDTQGNRPTGTNGMIRYNTSTSRMEIFENGGWTDVVQTFTDTGIVTLTGANGALVAGPATVKTISIDTGVTTGQIVQVDSGNRLPVIDGSQLTGISNIRGVNVSTTAPTGGQVLRYNGSAWEAFTLTDNAGVTLVAMGSGMVPGNISATGTISVDVGTGPNQIVQLDGSSRIPAVNGSLLTNVNAVQLQSNNVLSGVPADNQVLTWNSTGARWEPRAVPGDGGIITLTGVNGALVSGPATVKTIGIDTGVTTGQIVQVDSGNRLPVIDGSQLTGISNLRGVNVATTAPAANQVLKYNGSGWAPMADTGMDVAAGTGILLSGPATLKTISVDVGIGANQIPQYNPSGLLGIGTSTVTAGVIADFFGDTSANSAVLFPRATTANRPTTGVNGMIRYNTSLAKFEVYENGNWANMVASGADNLGNHTATTAILGVAGTAATPSFTFAGDPNTGIYSPGAEQIAFATDGAERMRVNNQEVILSGSLQLPSTTSSTTGVIYKGANRFVHDYAAAGTTGSNTFVGENSGNFSMAFNSGVSDASFNVGVGQNTLTSLTYGRQNTAVGRAALAATTTATGSTALGYNALTANTTGQNTAIGAFAADATTTGNSNSAIGFSALGANTTGSNNTALGHGALSSSTTASFNVAIGAGALDTSTTSGSVAVGYSALGGVTTGTGNVAVGYSAGNTTGVAVSNSTFIGYNTGSGALSTSTGNTVIGYSSGNTLSTGNGNILIGTDVEPTVGTASNELNLGNTLFGNLGSRTVAVGTATPSGTTAFEVYGTGNLSNMLIPRGTTAERAVTPQNGMIRYNTNTARFEVYETSWKNMVASSTGATNIDELTDGKTTGATDVLFLGANAGASSTGSDNTAVGSNSMDANTTGDRNTAVGVGTLGANLTGAANTAVGAYALAQSTNGANTAVGEMALFNITGGPGGNTAVGFRAQARNTTGTANVAMGTWSAGGGSASTYTQNGNTVIGDLAGVIMEAADNNILIGVNAADNLTTGSNNLIIGSNIDVMSATGSNQMAIGNMIFGLGIDGTGTTVSGGRIGIGAAAPSAGAVLEVLGTGNLSSMIVPRGTTVERAAAGINGMIRYNTNLSAFEVYANNQWATLATGSGGSTDIDGLSDGRTTGGTDVLFLGTTSAATGARNIGIGDRALEIATSGTDNTALGVDALSDMTNVNYNTAVGSQAGEEFTGDYSTIIGAGAMRYASSGGTNTAVGAFAADEAWGSYGNSVVGFNAMSNNTRGNDNVLMGWHAARGTGGFLIYNNVILGARAGEGLQSADNNVLIGYRAGNNLTTGDNNLIFGHDIDVPAAAGSFQMSLGNLIFGTSVNGTGTTVSGGRVGIRTNAPEAVLDVVGTGTASALIVPRDTTAARSGVGVNGMIRYNTNLSAFEVYANNQWATVATGSGGGSQWTTVSGNEIHYSTASVGIGTNNPGTIFHVYENNANDSYMTVENRNNGVAAASGISIQSEAAELGLRAYSNAFSGNFGGVSMADSVSIATSEFDVPSKMFVGTATAIPLYLMANKNPRITLSSAGLVGIGTTTPNAQTVLDIYGTGNISNMIVPRGLTSERAATPQNGMLRYNLNTSRFEAFENNQWVNLINVGSGGADGWIGDTVATAEARNSTTFGDLATAGPSVTIATGSSVAVTVTALMTTGTAARSCAMGFSVNGAAASDSQALMVRLTATSDTNRFSATFNVTGLTPGSNTFTAKYRDVTAANACTFADRNIVVVATAPPPCTDSAPDSFSFTNLTNQTTSTQVESDIVQVNGVTCSVPVSVTAASGSPQFRICADAGCSTVLQDWTTVPSNVAPGQYVRARVTTSALSGATTAVSVGVGTIATIWSVSTTGANCTDPSPPIGTICADGTIYAGLTPDGNVKMFTTRCDSGQTWDGVACTGARAGITWSNAYGSYTIGNHSTSAGKANTANAVDLVTAVSPYHGPLHCRNLNANGKTDWYLPASGELSVLYTNRTVLGNFDTSGTYYWSSTENTPMFPDYRARTVRFSTGAVSDDGKENSNFIRCVRSNLACTDSTPTAYPMPSLSNQATSTLVTSAITRLSGFDCAVATSISGQGTPQYRICSDVNCASVVQNWTSGASTIDPYQYIQLRMTTSGSGETTQTATMTAGGVNSNWQVSTAGTCAGLPGTPPPVGTVCPDGTVYAGLSPDGNVPMFTTRCDEGQTWDGSTCTGAAFTFSFSTNEAWIVHPGMANVTTGKANSAYFAARSDAGSPYPAAVQCEGITTNGYTDWYLPALNELNVLYGGKGAIGNFRTTSDDYYLSSTEEGDYNGYLVNFTTGVTAFWGRQGTGNYVRCVRR